MRRDEWQNSKEPGFGCNQKCCLYSLNSHLCTVGGGLDTCLVSTSDGVLRLPWKEVVYPKFIHDPSEELGLMSSQDSSALSRMSSEGGSSVGGWGGSSSGELDSWSWDDDEDEGLPPDGLDSAPALPSRRRSEDGLGRTARNSQLNGDYVELLEPRVGPDGGVDTQQRYLEMHGNCKTKTLPLCRRGKAIKLRKGRAWGHGRLEGSGSFRAAAGARREMGFTKDDILRPQPSRERNESARGRQSCSSSVQTSEDGDASRKDSEGLESPRLYFNGPVKERRPGVGKERDSNGLAQQCRDHHNCNDSEGGDNLATDDMRDSVNRRAGHASEGHSDRGSHSDAVFEDTDKPLSGDSDATTPTSDTAERPFASESGTMTSSRPKTNSLSPPKVTKERDQGRTENRVCPRGKEVKTAGFRAPRYTIISPTRHCVIVFLFTLPEIGEILVHLCAITKGSLSVQNAQSTFYRLLTFRCTSLAPSCALSLGGKGRERGQEEGLGLVVAHTRRDQNSCIKHRSRVPPPAPSRQSCQ